MAVRPTPSGAPSNARGCLILGVIIALFVIVTQCSSKNAASADSSENVSTTDINATGTAEPVATAATSGNPAPRTSGLDAKAVLAGLAKKRAVAAAQGLSGVMIFSQNCYDALGRAFNWTKLDECGAFDALAVEVLTDGDATANETEAAYFDAEKAAGRYLASATGAGEAEGKADEMWAQLQAKAKPAANSKKRSDAEIVEPYQDNGATPAGADGMQPQ